MNIVNLKHYTKEEAEKIISENEELQKDLADLRVDYENNELNHGFEFGNFFNFIEDPKKVVIQ